MRQVCGAGELTAQERTEYLLETYREAECVMGKGGGGDGSGLPPMMSELWHSGSYRKLESLLRTMRDTRPSQYWHVSARYLDAEDKVIEVKVTSRGREKRPILPPYTVTRGVPAFMPGNTARVAVRVYSKAVRLEKVRRGVDWLTSELDRQGGVWLPNLLLEAAA